jgi:16S rRNA G527 N7-methylase RsmG
VNKRVSLTRVGDFDAWFTNHVEDSILCFEFFKGHGVTEFVDCGSGNGLPGIIFAILSDLPFTLCDVDLRKCEFLRSAIFKLGLNGEVFSRPIIEFVPPSDGGDFCYVYRGLGPDKVLLENFKAHSLNSHFRLVSGQQTSLFKDSERKKYLLSDKSSREIEISL